MMASKTAKIFSFILLTNFLYIARVSSKDARQPLVQRSKPLPGSPVQLHVINLEKTSTMGNEEDIVVDGIAGKTLKRSRRAVNPDFNPKIVKVSTNLCFISLIVCCRSLTILWTDIHVTACKFPEFDFWS